MAARGLGGQSVRGGSYLSGCLECGDIFPVPIPRAETPLPSNIDPAIDLYAPFTPMPPSAHLTPPDRTNAEKKSAAYTYLSFPPRPARASTIASLSTRRSWTSSSRWSRPWLRLHLRGTSDAKEVDSRLESGSQLLRRLKVVYRRLWCVSGSLGSRSRGSRAFWGDV